MSICRQAGTYPSAIFKERANEVGAKKTAARSTLGLSSQGGFKKAERRFATGFRATIRLLSPPKPIGNRLCGARRQGAPARLAGQRFLS